MDFGSYIEEGVQKAGSRAALAEALAVSASQITNAKDRGVPVSACYALAELIGRDAGEIIAASELVTEKKPERRAVLMKYLARAASVSNIAACALIMTFGQSQDSKASQGVNCNNLEPVISRTRLLGLIRRIFKKFRHMHTQRCSQSNHRIGGHPTTMCNVPVQRGVRHA